MRKMKIILTSLLAIITACGDLSVGSSSKNDSDNTDTNIINNGNDNNSGKDSECSGTLSFDGPMGLLYKPESESDGKPVLLFPSELNVQFQSVLAETVEGDYVNGAFAGFTNPDRQTWRFDVEASKLSGYFVVESESGTCEVFVADPTTRQD